MDLGLRNRAYLVTGASRGLGRATAQVLVDEGAKVVLSARHRETVDTAVSELGEGSATGVIADNAAPETAGRLVEAAMSAYGRLDGALISVGGPPAGASSTSPTSSGAPPSTLSSSERWRWRALSSTPWETADRSPSCCPRR